MKKVAIAVFVKTPELTPCKTRLAVDLGQENAHEFYIESIKITQKLIQQITHKSFYIDPYFAVAEREGMDSPRWNAFHRVYQGEGKLGDRLANVYEELIIKYDTVIFLGADCPHIKSDVLYSAVDHFLSRPEQFVLGKSLDGGFYIFGGSCRLFSEIWTSIEYSQSDTAEKLVNSLGKIGKVKYLEESFDIDLLTDLEKYKFINKNKLNKTQLKFISWVNKEFLNKEKN
ncbi:MAG: DUF2064 domain-containing protein [Bacteriovoracaceae bacterium]|jgi:uncharacterized protein|nr:DUF2064 domain-containing protein [Bacteriovoracaceae bacterium]